MQSKFFIYNASAGSGKTYRLVINFLKLLLINDNFKRIHNILAITFTNKATFEMKNRLINWLINFSKDMNNTELRLISEELNIPIEICFERSKKLLSFIIHNYNLLNISTIDKFNLNLIRSFSKELNLAKNFNIETNIDEYINQAIEQLEDQMGQDNPYSNLLLDYYLWNFEQEKSNYNLINDLNNKTKFFLNEQNNLYFNEILKLNFIDFQIIRKNIKNRIKSKIKILTEEAKKTLEIIFNIGIDINDFPYKRNGVGQLIINISKGNFKNLNSYHLDFIENGNFENLSDDLRYNLDSIYFDIRKFLIFYQNIQNQLKLDKKILKDLIILELFSEIQKNLNEIKEENNIVFVSDFNEIIHNHLTHEPSAYIYEKIGTRINNYFFDEFQDTSQMQWDNFSPLLHEIMSYSGDQSISVVGDPKQSIYRFRGGKPEIMLNLIEQEKFDKQYKLIDLDVNYRSNKNIVYFNNEYYKFISSQLNNQNYKELFGSLSQQKAKIIEEGRVQVSLIENKNYVENVLIKITSIINECLANNFSLNDICILVKTNKDIIIISQFLKSNNFEISSSEALVLSSSPIIKSIIYFLKAIHTNIDNTQNWIKALYWWLTSKNIKTDNFNDYAYLFTSSGFDISSYIQEMFDIKISNWKEEISLYEYVENFIRDLRYGENEKSWIISFLNLIYEFEKNKSKNIFDFLNYWDLEGYKKGIDSIKKDSINIYTIHKSKGLEFPIVIIPNLSNKKNQEKIWIPLDKNKYFNLPYLFTTKNDLNNINKSIDKAIKDFEFDSYIDEICTQYVATTRAKQQLFIIEKIIKSNNKSLIIKYLKYKKIPIKPTTYELFSTNDLINTIKIKPNIFKNELSVEWISQTWQDFIDFSLTNNEDLNKYEFGELLHEILSKIYTSNDVENQLEEFILNGKISQNDKMFYQKVLYKIINQPKINFLYQKDCISYNEKEILYKNNFYRPDKWVIKNEKNYLIDYKSGNPKIEDKEQLNNYKTIFKSLQKPIEKAYLIYIFRDCEVIEV